MLKVECESCKAPYQIDERRVPAAGLKMRCPKCGHSFVVKSPNAPASAATQAGPPPPAAPAAPRAAPRPPPPAPEPPRAAAPAPAPPPQRPVPKPSLPAALGDLDLPAIAPVDLPAPVAARPVAAPPIAKKTMIGQAPPPRIVKVGQPTFTGQAPVLPPVAKPAPAAPPPPDFSFDLPSLSGGGEADLPAVASDLPATRGPGAGVGLPAAKAGGPPPRAVGRSTVAFGAANLPPIDIDLPSPANIGLPSSLAAADLPSRAHDDLPSPANIGLPSPANIGLPSPANIGLPSTATVGLPSAARVAMPSGPQISSAVSKRTMGFGEIDLPSAQNDLPSIASALPSVASALPSVASSLPSVASSLPAVANALPVVANSLPTVQQTAQQLPGRITDGRHLPSPGLNMGAASLPPAFGGGDDFGELELPRAGAAVGPPPLGDFSPPHGEAPSFPPPSEAPPGGGAGAGFGNLFDENPFTSSPPPAQPPAHAAHGMDSGDGGFGELELPVPPNENKPASFPPLSASTGGSVAGGMSFGELDLGGGNDPMPGGGGPDNPFGEASLGSVIQPPPNAPRHEVSRVSQLGSLPEPGHADVFGAPAGEATIDAPAKPRRERGADSERRPSAIPKIIAALAALIVLGGVGLALTPYGMFGMNAIQDAAHSGEYAKAAEDGLTQLHEGLKTDVFVDARAVADKLAQARASRPRARAFTAVAAIAELETELRFGKDPEHANRVKVWLTHDIPEPRSSVRYLDVAQAAVLAIDGEKDKARAGFDAATKKYASDPILQDLYFMRGELEYRARDGAAATAAYTKALAIAPGARAHFGLARAAFLVGDYKTAAKELDATIAASPSHADALLVRAAMTWAQGHDDAAAESALKDLAAALEGVAKTKISDTDAAEAYAKRGEIQLSRGRSAQAREAFEAALKRDARNVPALVGQGEVLYDEGRYTEAITRLDTAIQVDPNNARAIVGDAKTKIALEHLAEAKAQLVDAVKRLPKSAQLTRWLGAAEAALGNKVEAEKNLTAAIALVDPKDPDAIEPYAALAGFLASQGRADDAAARLVEAQQKLPDSGPMERALGDVAIAQGHFDESIAHYESALKRDSQDVQSRFRLGQAMRKMNRIDEASKVFDLVYAADKNFPSLSLERGLLFEQSGDVQKALDQFQSALAKSPTDPDLQLRVGAAYVVINKPDQALEMLKKVLMQRTSSAEAEHYLGRALMEKGPLEYQQAMAHLTLAAGRDTNRAEYHLYVGWLANILPQPDPGLARKEIGKALELDQTLADGYWQRGVLEYQVGANLDAQRDLLHALELKPTRYEAHATLAQVYEQLNRIDAAIAEWRAAFARDDEDALWNFRFGKLLLDRGAYAEAAKYLKFAVETAEKEQPRPGWIKAAEYPAALALDRSGNTKEAIEHYRLFMTWGDQNNPDRRDAEARLRKLGAPYEPER